MALSNLNTMWKYENYIGDRNYLIQTKENNALYVTQNDLLTKLDVHNDGTDLLAMGYGYDLFQHRDSFANDLSTLTIVLESDENGILKDESILLNEIQTLIQANSVGTYDSEGKLIKYVFQSTPTITSANQLRDIINSKITLSTHENAVTLLNNQIASFEAKLDTTIGFIMEESQERAALVSMIYNGGTGLIGGGLKHSLTNDLRAEAWFQIRYDTNGGASRTSVGYGIANRRVDESDLFGLFGSDGYNEESTKAAFRMYTIHKEHIKSEGLKGTGYLKKIGDCSLSLLYYYIFAFPKLFSPQKSMQKAHPKSQQPFGCPKSIKKVSCCG